MRPRSPQTTTRIDLGLEMASDIQQPQQQPQASLSEHAQSSAAPNDAGRIGWLFVPSCELPRYLCAT